MESAVGQALHVVDADAGLVERIGGSDMVRGNTISRQWVSMVRKDVRCVWLWLTPDLNSRIESFEYGGRKVTNYEMESAPLQGLARLMGHRAMTVCSIIANRFNTDVNPSYKNAVHDLIRWCWSASEVGSCDRDKAAETACPPRSPRSGACVWQCV